MAGLVCVAVNEMMDGGRCGEGLNEEEKNQRQEREDALAWPRLEREICPQLAHGGDTVGEMGNSRKRFFVTRRHPRMMADRADLFPQK